MNQSAPDRGKAAALLWLLVLGACGAAAVEPPAPSPGSRPPPFTLPPEAPGSVRRDAAAAPNLFDAGGCVSESHEATRLPVDLLLLLDVSSSMADPVAGGTESKWQIIQAALVAFLRDTRSAGLQVGLQFFPLGSSCALADYQKLAVNFVELPTVLPALAAALHGQNVRLNFGTPTGMALAGAHEALRLRLRSLPPRRAALLLLTDSEPTACTPLLIDEVAAPVGEARAMNPSVATYVIGVFTPAELVRAKDTVEKLAMVGGTSAFVLEAGIDLSARLSEVLDQIRDLGVPCEFDIPQPRQHILDFGRVNVRFSSATGAQEIPYVRGAGRCDSHRGGWYYDFDPTIGAKPSRVVTCPATCRAFKADRAARVDLMFGCRTLPIP
jgi:hypothetical protein